MAFEDAPGPAVECWSFTRNGPKRGNLPPWNWKAVLLIVFAAFWLAMLLGEMVRCLVQ